MSIKSNFSMKIFIWIVLFFFRSLFLAYAEIDIDTVMHKGDLILTGNQHRRIENKNFILIGDLSIRDNAKLTIINSTIITESEYHHQYGWNIQDNGTLEAHYSRFLHDDNFGTYIYGNSNFILQNCETVMAELSPSESANVRIINSIIDFGIGTSFWPESQGNNTKIYISKSKVKGFGLNFPADSYASINNLVPGESLYWEFPGASNSNVPYEIIFNDVEVELFNMRCTGNSKATLNNCIMDEVAVYDQAFARCINCALLHVSIVHTINKYFRLENVKLGKRIPVPEEWWKKYQIFDYIKNFNIKRHVKGEFLKRLIIRKSYVNEFNMHYMGEGRAEIINTDFSELGVSGHLISKINKCDIAGFRVSTFYGTLIFSKSILNDWDYFYDNNFKMKGKVLIKDSFKPEPKGKILNKFFMDREYIVYTQHGGSRIENADLRVENRSGEILWQGVSDAKGVARFEVSFTYKNLHKEFKLKSDILNNELKFNVNSSTPMRLKKK